MNAPGEVRIENDPPLSVEPWPFDRLDAAAALTMKPPPVPFFVPGQLVQGRGHILNGIGGSSKTTALLQLAMAAATGRLSWGWDVPPGSLGSALVLVAEDIGDDTWRKVHAVADALNLTPSERRAAASRLHLYPLAGKSVNLLFVRRDGTIGRTALYESLIALCSQTPNLRFVGVDPAIRFTEGSESDSTHQRALGDMADALAITTGACVVMTTHGAKASQTSDDLASHSSRGAGSITDAVRGEYVLQTMTAVEAKARGIVDMAERKSFVRLQMVKGNFAPPESFVERWLRRSDHGVLVDADAALPERVKGGGREGAPTTADMRGLDVLWQLANGRCAKASEWRAACIEKEVITAKTDQGQQNALTTMAKRLVEARLVIRVGEGKATAYSPRSTTNGPWNDQ